MGFIPKEHVNRDDDAYQHLCPYRPDVWGVDFFGESFTIGDRVRTICGIWINRHGNVLDICNLGNQVAVAVNFVGEGTRIVELKQIQKI